MHYLIFDYLYKNKVNQSYCLFTIVDYVYQMSNKCILPDIVFFNLVNDIGNFYERKTLL